MRATISIGTALALFRGGDAHVGFAVARPIRNKTSGAPGKAPTE
ncbi:MAG TPA: hypothetical protein VME41_09035 [Stellaceae bacterium]|nr:hypothetical protein [Stellaceae bacterium]